MNLKEYNHALIALENFIYNKVQGIPFTVIDDAPNTYRSMVEFYNKNGYFGVSKESSDTSIYINPSYYNVAFRAIHDKMHYELGLTFSFEDEKILSDITAHEVSQYAMEVLGYTKYEAYNVRKLVNAEIKGQIEYYEQTGEYVENQKEFVMKYLKVK